MRLIIVDISAAPVVTAPATVMVWKKVLKYPFLAKMPTLTPIKMLTTLKSAAPAPQYAKMTFDVTPMTAPDIGPYIYAEMNVP